MAIPRQRSYWLIGLLAAIAVGLWLRGEGRAIAAHDPAGHPPGATHPERPAPDAARVLRVMGVVQAKPALVAHVTAPIWGRLEAVPKPMVAGQPVRKGEPLARLVLELSADERYLMEARRVEIQAAATVARARRQQADRDFRQAVELLKVAPGDPYRRQQVDATERLLKAAAEEQSLYDRSEKAFDTVIQRRDPRITVVEAPIAGVITDVAIRPGERNPTGTFRQLCTITDLSRVWIAAAVFERDLGAALSGAKVTFSTSEGGAPRALGSPVAILPWIDEQKRTLTMIFEVSNADRQLALGMTVYVTMAVSAPPHGE